MALPLKIWDGTQWIDIGVQGGTVLYQNEEPASPETGMIWIDADSETSVVDADTFLTQSTASATYAPSASPTFTGEVNLPATTNYDGSLLSDTLASKQADVMTTKGDLAAYGTDVARLGVGSNGQVLTADSGETLGVKWADASGGLTLITTETFSAVSSVSVNGCFTSTYANYKIVIGMVGHSLSGDTALNMRMRASGSDDTASNYFWARVAGNSAGTSFIGGGTSANLWQVSFTSASKANLASMEVFTPQATARTGFGVGSNIDGGTAPYLSTYGGWFNDTTAFDGFSLITASGNMTGTLRVYGYKD